MLKHYFINKKSDKDPNQVVHDEYCRQRPTVTEALYVGMFNNCSDAIKEAQKEYKHAIVCPKCLCDCKPD